jgi:hypothetical protein
MSEDEEFERGNARWRAEVQTAVERRDVAALQKLNAPLGTVYNPPIPQTQNAAGTKTEVSRRVLTARINRKLARQGLRLRHELGTGPETDYWIGPWPLTDAWNGLILPALYRLFRLEGLARKLGVLRDDEFVVEKTVRRSRPLRSLVRRPKRSDGMEDLLKMGIIVDTGRLRNGRPVYALTSLGKTMTAHEDLLECLRAGAPAKH